MMSMQKLPVVLGITAGLALFGVLTPTNAQVVDDLEDIGPDCTPVLTRVIGGVTVTITTQNETVMSARTYYPYYDPNDYCYAFVGHESIDNAPLSPDNVTATRFISTIDSNLWFPEAEPIVFQFDSPVSAFGLTTVDLLENGPTCDPDNAWLKLEGRDAGGGVVTFHLVDEPQGSSGVDVHLFVSGPGIVEARLTGGSFGDCRAYGIDDLVLDAPDCDGDGIFDDHDVCPCVPAPGGVDDEGRPLGDLDGDCDVDIDDFTIMQQNFTGPNGS
jgi:hypothetical protein